MLSAVIHARHSYPAMLLAEQLADQRSVHSGPLVLGANLLKYLRLQQIGDQPVSRFVYTHYCVEWTISSPTLCLRKGRRHALSLYGR